MADVIVLDEISTLGETINNLISINTEHGSKTFTSSGTWTVPEGVGIVYVTLIGGGGGGGCMGSAGSSYDPGYGAGGGSGGFTQAICPVTQKSNVTITVGTGGAGGTGKSGSNSSSTVHGDSGKDGGDSSFGSFAYANGGKGGEGGTGAYNTSTSNGSSYYSAKESKGGKGGTININGIGVKLYCVAGNDGENGHYSTGKSMSGGMAVDNTTTAGSGGSGVGSTESKDISINGSPGSAGRVSIFW